MPTNSRARLHDMVDRIPAAMVPLSTEILEAIVNSELFRILEDAPPEDERISDEERRFVAEAEEELGRGSEPVPLEEVKRRYGIE